MVTLPIFWNSPEAIQKEKMGFEVPLEESDIKHVTFININGFCAYEQDGVQCSRLYANGMVFICALTETELISKLKPILK